MENDKRIKFFTDLVIWQKAHKLVLMIYKITENFPKEEKYSLTDQIRRSSRSVSANIAEAWRKQRYPKSFISKLSDSESEAAETQTWLDYALAFKYVDKQAHEKLYDKYEHIIAMLINMSTNPEQWKI